MSCTGVILAGGGATRFGGAPKGLERVGGERIIDRVAAALRAVSDELLLVANAPDADRWLDGVRRVKDVRTGAGALGGLHAALAHAGTSVLVVAWDMPFVPSALLAALRTRGEDSATPAATPAAKSAATSAAMSASARLDAVLPESDGSRRGVEPLCAWYSERCLAAIEACLDRDDLRVIGFHGEARIGHLTIEEVRAFGDPARIFSNVNTRDDLALATAAEVPRV